MGKEYSYISDISILNSKVREKDEIMELFNIGLFSEPGLWDDFKISENITGLPDNINSRMKYSMSKLSLGIYNVLDRGPYINLKNTDEIILFTGFAEIEAVNKIGKLIMEQNYSINPALFPNSVAHVSLSYFTILKKISNYTVAINDGLGTNFAFINFILDRALVPVDYIIACGEENSLFFSYEINKKLDIVSSFIAYKIIPMQEKGFKFINVYNDINEVVGCSIFKQTDTLLCDKNTFMILKDLKIDKKIFCEYPIVKDNPCGVIFRLALPFYLDFKGVSLVIEKIKLQYYLFEVNL